MGANKPETSKRWQNERRAKLNELKLSLGGCVDCGYNAHPAALHWDHRPGTDKPAGVRKAFERTWAWDRILAEIAKCDLVCANCHAIRTAARGYVANQQAARAPIVPGEFGRLRTTDLAQRTHCRHGHKITPDSIYVSPKGHKQCRPCAAERESARHPSHQ